MHTPFCPVICGQYEAFLRCRQPCTSRRRPCKHVNQHTKSVVTLSLLRLFRYKLLSPCFLQRPTAFSASGPVSAKSALLLETARLFEPKGNKRLAKTNETRHTVAACCAMVRLTRESSMRFHCVCYSVLRSHIGIEPGP
jgi:hypothetical protein